MGAHTDYCAICFLCVILSKKEHNITVDQLMFVAINVCVSANQSILPAIKDTCYRLAKMEHWAKRLFVGF